MKALPLFQRLNKMAEESMDVVQISQEADQVVWYSHLLKNFPQFIVIHIIKRFGIVQSHMSAAVDSFPQVSTGCLLCWRRTGRGFKGSKSCLCSHNCWPLLVKDVYSNLIPAKKNFFLTIQSVSLYRKQLQPRAVLPVLSPLPQMSVCCHG